MNRYKLHQPVKRIIATKKMVKGSRVISIDGIITGTVLEFWDGGKRVLLERDSIRGDYVPPGALPMYTTADFKVME